MTSPLDAPRARARRTSEQQLATRILREIRDAGGAAIKTTGTATAGTPDIIGALHGVPLAWEIKLPHGHTTPLQDHHLAAWGAAGARAHTVRTVAHARALIADITTNHTRRTSA